MCPAVLHFFVLFRGRDDGGDNGMLLCLGILVFAHDYL